MKAPVPDNRRNPLFFEADGDFNPGWALFIAFSLEGLLVSGAAIVGLVRKPEVWQLGAVSLGFIVFAMIATAIIVVPIARAKLLVQLKGAPGEIAGAAAIGGGLMAMGFTAAAPGEILTADHLEPPTGQGRPGDED